MSLREDQLPETVIRLYWAAACSPANTEGCSSAKKGQAGHSCTDLAHMAACQLSQLRRRAGFVLHQDCPGAQRWRAIHLFCHQPCTWLRGQHWNRSQHEMQSADAPATSCAMEPVLGCSSSSAAPSPRLYRRLMAHSTACRSGTWCRKQLAVAGCLIEWQHGKSSSR